MGAAGNHPFKFLAIAFLCVAVAFAALALSGTEQPLAYGLIALTNLCVGMVFFSRSRAAQQEDGQK